MRLRTAVPPFLLAVLLTVAVAVPVSARSAVAATEQPSIHVRIVDAVTGLPIGGVEVAVSFEEGDPDHPIPTDVIYNAVTNGGGHVLFKGLQPGLYVISAADEGLYYFFGHTSDGHRLAAGLTVSVERSPHGGVHAVIRLVPLCPDCRVTR